MTDEPKLSQEHKVLLAEAIELGLDVYGYSDPDANLDGLREMIARQTQALAREAMHKRRAEAAAGMRADEERNAIRSAFDETMASTRGVLIRQVEWSEWLPVSQDGNEPRLTIANGVTGFEAGESEKVLSVDGVGTQIFKEVKDPDEPGLSQRYMLYAFKATLAQNVHTSLVATLVDAQGSNQEGEEQVKKRPSGLITPDDGMPQGPNRHQRRHPHG
jgi:hypothetical protein